MCGKTSLHQSSHREHDYQLFKQNSIGELFRDHGENYIKTYHPSQQQIKLIRAIRVCKTPALGGHLYTCKDCGKKHYVYNSCGHSHCMLCQSIKREQWVDKLKASLLKVPYVHTVFTLPHQLNGLTKQNEKQMYSLIMKVSWLTIKTIANKYGAFPGMTSVLHTFGSDTKYHIHVHSLITFGGLGKDNEWLYPPRKKLLAKYREMCAMYKCIFLRELNKLIVSQKIKYHNDIEPLIKEISKVRWVVHSTYPTMNTSIIEDYLAKYINRIAISNKRLDYVKESEKVIITYNNYKQQKAGEKAPKAYLNLDPLVAIDQIMQHVLPPYFQKSRRYGLHNSSTKVKKSIPEKLKRNGLTIRTIIEIITHLSKLTPFKCDNCESQNYEVEEITPNKRWIYNFITLTSLKSPPKPIQHITFPLHCSAAAKIPMPRNAKKHTPASQKHDSMAH